MFAWAFCCFKRANVEAGSKITYSVGFKNNGKITALELKILLDAGIYRDVSLMLPQNIVSTLRKYDRGALSFDIEDSFIAEAVIENVAAALSMDVDLVRTQKH
ncbi:hypothetical protein RIF29_22549 [Crotalaria pallida]|uniref:Aldehyde oxidase/xanthine dehydrogenase first molybdopterin binding domain-containing protein n=1 Tax=Crotalaria pallida TaxID=3830 RepID=A0AAN9F913_CROPI